MKLQVIVGSNRPQRVSYKVGQWVAKEARNLEGIEVEIVDLQDHDLPFLDDPMSPQFNPNRKPNPPAQQWLDKLAEADGYVIVTPEYNRSIPGSLKNALDYIDFQFAKKPVSTVAHGSTGGAQAAGSLRAVLSGLKAAILPTVTYVIGRGDELFDDQGNLVDESLKANPYGPQGALKATIEEVGWYTKALATARAQG